MDCKGLANIFLSCTWILERSSMRQRIVKNAAARIMQGQ